MRGQVKFGSRSVDYTVKFSARKTLGIRVHPDLHVEVLAPDGTAKDKIMDKVRQKAPWIVKQLDYFESFRPATPPRRYISGETHLYLGRQYRLKVVQDEEKVIKAYRGQLWIHATDIRPEALQKQLQAWYRQRAEVIFQEVLEEVLPKFRRYKVGRPELVVRKMDKRWGSCTPKGRILLNTDLIKASRGCIVYVLVHELCHLVHYNHKAQFRALLQRMMPDWQHWKEKLEKTIQ